MTTNTEKDLVKLQRTRIEESVENNKELYIKTSHAIHANPEIGNQEFFASDTLTQILEKAGFDIERNIAGHETAFVARKSSFISGPKIAFLAEYDALPGLGHACGHNIIGTASVAAGIALAEVINETGGEVFVFGTPAEEGGPNGSAKASFVKHGLLEDIDVCLMIHPSGKTSLTKPTLAVEPLDFHFFGKAAHASAAPEEGINALDAVILLFNGINALRQQLPKDVHIHGIITHGGEAPNIIPEYASARFFIRANTWKMTEEVANQVRQIAEGAALATGAKVEIERFQNEIHAFKINSTLDSIIKEELIYLGEEVHEVSGDAQGSTDSGNISQVVPTAHPYIKIGPDDLVAHTIEFREAARSEKGDEALMNGAKVLALTAHRLLTDSFLLKQVRDDFEKQNK